MTSTLSLLVHGDIDVLSRTVVLFATRGVRVESLSFGPAGSPGVSRLTAVVALAEGRTVTQLVRQLNRLVDVIGVIEPAESAEPALRTDLARVAAP